MQPRNGIGIAIYVKHTRKAKLLSKLSSPVAARFWLLKLMLLSGVIMEDRDKHIFLWQHF